MEHDAESSRRYKENWDDAVQASKADAAELAEFKAQAAVTIQAMAIALDLIVRRLQADIDDGSRPDQWSMESLVQKAREALPAEWVIGAA